MAEALAVVSLSASILQFVTLTAELTQRINEFNSTAEELPKALRSIHTQLPFLLETCQNLDTGDQSENTLAIVKECHREIEDLYKTVNKILPGPGDPKLRRAFKALKSMHYQEKFDHALRRIEHFKTDLILHYCQATTDSSKDFPPASKITHSLPSAPMASSITRRKLLREISRKFLDYDYEGTGFKIVILHGMGGQGKSRLALDYGRQVSTQSDSTLVLWFDATTKQTLTRSFEDIADRWNSRKRRFVDAESRMQYVNEILADRKWLLIFDNYDHPDHFADLCDFIPPGDGSVLITSRHADAGLVGKVMQIAGMDEGEGLELLRRRTEQNLDEPVNRAAAIEVLQTLGYLPLAIDQAGAYIREQRLPMQQFLQHYESQKETVLDQKHVYWDYKKKIHGADKAETPLGVLTTWELSIQQIGFTHVTQGVVEHLLTVAAFLSHFDISESLFRVYAQRTRPVPEWLGCFMSKGEWDPHRYRNMVSKLLKLTLAQDQNSNAGECYLSLHPMVKDWLQSRITESDRTSYIMETINILANYIDTNVQERSLQEARGLLGHLDACMNSHSKFRTAACRLGFGHLRKHTLTFSAFYMSHGRYREAEEGLQAVLEHDVQEYGQKHVRTFQTTRHLADALVHGGKYDKAHDLLSKALHDSNGPVNTETLHIVSALAAVFAKLDRQADAERYYEKALQGHSLRKDKVEPRDVYSLYGRLAEVKRFLGKHEEAKTLYMKAYTGYQEDCAYDEDATSDMLRAAGGLADLHRMHGQYAEAERSYREAWQGYKMSLGPDHPMTTAMLTNLAISCRNQGKFEDAENYLEESVKVFQKTLGPDHPDSLRAMMNLSICIDKQGHYKEAEIKYREVLKGREKKLGLNHPHTRRTLERLAHMLWMQGLHHKAETVIRKVLTKAGSLLVENQPGSSDHATFPALTALYTEARKRDRSKLAPDHVDALETCECLRLIYIEQGEYEKAKELKEQIRSVTSRKETDEDQKKLDGKQKPFTPVSKEYDVERSIHHSEVTRSPHELVQQAQKALVTKRSILLFGLLLWIFNTYWSNYSNRTHGEIHPG
ncbi:MAG: hypothetical protein LQ343_000670 [Gyalolechia ehrenbergii]|nr:MAG: hypothetical protein LQ343_000670 [Gyalolechia ehrenbergii]